MENKDKGQELINFIYTMAKQGYSKDEIQKEIEKKWREKNDR